MCWLTKNQTAGNYMCVHAMKRKTLLEPMKKQEQLTLFPGVCLTFVCVTSRCTLDTVHHFRSVHHSKVQQHLQPYVHGWKFLRSYCWPTYHVVLLFNYPVDSFLRLSWSALVEYRKEDLILIPSVKRHLAARFNSPMNLRMTFHFDWYDVVYPHTVFKGNSEKGPK